MRKNVGTIDRMLRGVVGVLVLVAGFYMGSLWGLLGLIPLGTAIVGWCPPYAAFGMSTCNTKSVEG